MKKCPTCNKIKNLEEFYKSKRAKDGLYWQCKECTKKAKKKWREANKKLIYGYNKKYVLKNKEKVKKWQKNHYEKHKKTMLLQQKEYRKTHPWYSHLVSCRFRCNNPKTDSYKYYGGRGIKCLLGVEDIKYLWFRDKAYLLKEPSIDREENDGNYTLENCRFIELVDNIAKAHRKIAV